MHNALADRQQAVRLRLAGESIDSICHTLKRTKPWFHKWWQRYLAGDKTRYYFLVCKDVFDQAVYLEFVDSRAMDGMITFLIHAWQLLGLPEAVQFDNGKEFCGWGRWPRSISRVIRLCVRLGIEPVFIPEGKPQHNGSVEHFNGWFQPLLLRHRFGTPDEVRHELQQLITTVNEQHVHVQLGYRTPAQYRRGQRLRKLPVDFTVDSTRLPLAAGKITFIRLVSAQGQISVLGESLKIGKRLKFQYVKATLYTKTETVKVYHNGRLVKQLRYKIRRS